MTTFTGFDPSAFGFLRDLADHNDRAWFREHQDVYKEHLLEPARAIVVAMGERLAERSPGIHADPRVNGSILRIARDTRLSGDPTPYRTTWRSGSGRGTARAASARATSCASTPTPSSWAPACTTSPIASFTNIAAPSTPTTAAPISSGRLRAAARAGAQLGRARWKRVPAPYPADHPRADLLRQGGLAAAITVPLPAEAHGPGFPAWCAKRWNPLAPLQAWVAGVAAAAG